MEAVTDTLKETLLHELLPPLWKCFTDNNKCSPEDALSCILVGLNEFIKQLHTIQYGVSDSVLRRCVRLAVGITVPDAVYSVVQCIVNHSLSVINDGMVYSNQFHSLVNILQSIGLVDCFLSHSIAVTIETKVKEHISIQCSTVYDERSLGGVIKDINALMEEWITGIYGSVSDEWSCRILYYIYSSYCRLRISELFDIIVEYPDSLPVLEDIKECLTHVNMRQELMDTLTLVYKRRLLHHGANTAVIITQYISSIRCLMILDSSGVILERVCDPVRTYLRSRDDTVTCIMASLIDDNTNDLSEELAKGDTVLLDLSDDSSDQDFDSWYPDPVDADPSKSSKSRQTSDVISLLVHIYGSQEVFVNEYRTLLADRLLMTLDYDTTRELRNLELLKLRFGESNLHYCEVMVKDITDSRRVNGLINSRMGKSDVSVNLFILSHVFWPSFKHESIKSPSFIQSTLDQCNKCYRDIKGMRRLEWCTSLGQVHLELEINGKCTEYHVTPPRACIIYMYQEQNVWSVDELCRKLDSVPSVIRRHLLYWVSQGVLYEGTVDVFSAVMDSVYSDDRGVVEEECGLSSIEDQKESDLQVVWSYVSAMLTNLGPLPLDRIHSMLKMFMSSSGGVVSINELKSYLDKKIKSQEMLLINGTYQLNNN